MPKTVAMMDYGMCRPEKCNYGVCIAAQECEYESLIQKSPYEAPQINLGKWCHGCAKCAQACSLKAIRMLPG